MELKCWLFKNKAKATVIINLSCKILEDAFERKIGTQQESGNKNSMPQMETIRGVAVIASKHVKQTKKRNAMVTRKSSYASRFADKMCLRGGQERQMPLIREATGDCLSKWSCSFGARRKS
jgi:hypothetical protein